MLSRIIAFTTLAGLIAIAVISNVGDESTTGLRRKLQQMQPPQTMFGGGFQGGNSGGGNWGPPGPQSNSGGWGGPPPQGQSGFGPPPQQPGGGFGPPHQQAGFGPPPQQQQFPGPPQQQFGPAQNQGSGFGPPPQQQQQQSQNFFPPAPEVKQSFGNSNVGGNSQDQSQQMPPQSQSSNQGGQAGGACDLREAQELKVIPTWTASFPASGSKILGQVIEQLTGIASSDDNDSTGRLKKGVCVAVKTHFPTKHVSPKFWVMDTSHVKHAILLVRNPIDVMPSYFKFLYRFEEKNDPTVEPPLDRWVAWRNENFNEQMDKWAEHTDWWMKNYAESGKLMILPFEHFTNREKGPGTLRAIGTFLSKVDPTVSNNMTPDGQMKCLWNKVVGEHSPEKDKAAKRKAMNMGGPRYPYTIEQLDNMVKVLKNLKKAHSAVPQLSDALSDYIKGVTAARRQVQKLLDG